MTDEFLKFYPPTNDDEAALWANMRPHGFYHLRQKTNAIVAQYCANHIKAE